MSTAVAARINGKTIELFDRNGNSVNSAGATGLAYDEKWVNAYVNGNLLVATSDRGTMVTWELRPNSSPVVIGRR